MIQESEGFHGQQAGWWEIRQERIPRRTRWERRAGQWRALELARKVFGPATAGHLEGFPPRGGFRGLLHLSVPFRDLKDHQEREGLFLHLAALDPVLERVPLVFAFSPVPEAATTKGGG